ncbi:penicillin-insensitive murein endopeptidase [Rhodopila sp.]|uniref:penicillin-insensitive murein endopeptidase n=1 Tax=Rhodopila sp. TaxID=2480087 RepID=UPI002C2D653D|nr:penicillin-insensitive murein endopeptidase [Rhodopila sp.]HVZ08235.1 penicillin-insensitive murein endopeptidase [Rhodopila sp.]
MLSTVSALAGYGPAPGPLRVIGGGKGGGCIAGAVELPAQGTGFQTIHMSRSDFWGAPGTIAGLEMLARQASAAGLPSLLIEDISHPRGGPMQGGHISHQIGVDADVGLDMRPRPPIQAAQLETVELASMVRPDGRDIDPSVWSARVITLLRLATAVPGVDRVLVNPAIKQALCRDVSGDRTWLRMIRPWWGHAAHMHIHFRCPPGQSECQDITPIPAGDGCDETLAWWFTQLDRPPAKPGRPPKPLPLPAACKAILSGR